MSQERLNGLAILSIEQDLLENIEYKSLINNFVAETVYRVIFQYFFSFFLFFFIFIFFFNFKIEGFIFLHRPGLIIPKTGPDRLVFL